MKIGILTYYRVANFGANLQALSTYKYLENHGHTPIMIHYMSSELYNKTDVKRDVEPQIDMHLSFVDKNMPNHTDLCFSAEEINAQIKQHNIEAIIVGADAVLQHHPFISRIYLSGRRIKRFNLKKIGKERIFPNLFWGIGIEEDIKMVMMSVSSQNAQYLTFDPITKWRMKLALKRYCALSVRDEWTLNFMHNIGLRNIEITPDPVFAFNQNVRDMIPSKKEILMEFGLPDKYILVSFLEYPTNENLFLDLKAVFAKDRIACVALPSPAGVRFNHNYDFSIPTPLSPIDWYALITHSCGYIGNNMHPIISALHNGVPCVSIDNYMLYEKIDCEASKIYDILKRFGLERNYITPEKLEKEIDANFVYELICTFPVDKIKSIAETRLVEYNQMMVKLLNIITK